MNNLSRNKVVDFIVGFDRFTKDQGHHPLLVDRAFRLAVDIVQHFLGSQWVQKHREDEQGLLSDSRLGSNSACGIWESTGKVVRLAELLLNFQDVVGFEEIVDKLREDDFESHFVELESAVMLLTAGFQFRFVKPVSQRGRDYDIAITLEDGSNVPLEVESKTKTTTLSEKTIINTIEHARRQLPRNEPGFILMRIPDGWWKEYVGFEGGLVRTISRHLNFPNPRSRSKPEYILNLADRTWNKAGRWDYLAEIIMCVLGIPPDDSFRKINVTPSSHSEIR